MNHHNQQDISEENTDQLLNEVNNIIENVILTLQHEKRVEGKDKLLGLKEKMMSKLKSSSDKIDSMNENNKLLIKENEDLNELSEENKIRIEGLEADLGNKLLKENKKLKKLIDKLDSEESETSKMVIDLYKQVMSGTLDNQRMWKMKKTMTKEMMNNEYELYGQMEILYSALTDKITNK